MQCRFPYRRRSLLRRRSDVVATLQTPQRLRALQRSCAQTQVQGKSQGAELDWDQCHRLQRVAVVLLDRSINCEKTEGVSCHSMCLVSVA